MLSIEGLSLTRAGKPILRDVSFQARSGEVTAIVGPNGAGKSSLLECAVGALPHEGSIAVDGADLDALPPRERAQRVAYVPQRSALRAALSVRDVVAHGRYSHQSGVGGTSEEDRLAIDNALSRLELQPLAGRSYLRLSMGEQQRVMIARALATKAPVLLLDEPTSSLDVRQALSALHTIQSLAEEGLAVVVVLHGLDAVLRFSHAAVLLDEGKVVAMGKTDEVITAERVADVYGVRMEKSPGWRFALENDEP